MRGRGGLVGRFVFLKVGRIACASLLYGNPVGDKRRCQRLRNVVYKGRETKKNTEKTRRGVKKSEGCRKTSAISLFESTSSHFGLIAILQNTLLTRGTWQRYGTVTHQIASDALVASCLSVLCRLRASPSMTRMTPTPAFGH